MQHFTLDPNVPQMPAWLNDPVYDQIVTYPDGRSETLRNKAWRQILEAQAKTRTRWIVGGVVALMIGYIALR